MEHLELWGRNTDHSTPCWIDRYILGSCSAIWAFFCFYISAAVKSKVSNVAWIHLTKGRNNISLHNSSLSNRSTHWYIISNRMDSEASASRLRLDVLVGLVHLLSATFVELDLPNGNITITNNRRLPSTDG